MKTKYVLGLILLFGALFSCKNEDKFQDVLYITGTEINSTVPLAVDGPTSMGVSVTSSALAVNDVVVDLSFAPELVADYNAKNGKNYKFLPEGTCALSEKSVTIKSGTNVSNSVMLDITAVDKFEEGVTYMTPIKIANVQGGTQVLESSRVIYVVLSKTINTVAASLENNYFEVDFARDHSLSSIPSITIEARVRVNSYQSSSPFISSVMGIEENFLMRFGDVGVPNNQLQLSGGGFQVASSQSLSTNTWYHLAIVYDGVDIKMYINGKLESSKAAPRGNIDLTDKGVGAAGHRGFFFGYTPQYGRPLDGAISEARVWTKALSQNDLQNGVCYVDPKSPGLLAYWRFNENTGNISKDITGHGFDAIAPSTVSWVPGVKCPD